ncbi:unnamed protein product [Rotaria sp. Silwood2]|nr:unnamed protein product [Rotaria sp. Silwood2]
MEVPNQGIGFCALSTKHTFNYPCVSFNYLGEFLIDMRANDSEEEWNLLDIFCDNTLNATTNESIKVTSFIVNKEIRFSINTKLGINRTLQFAKEFQSNIEKIIKHTQSVNRSYLTMSDIHYVIKSNDYLNRIQLEKEVDAIFMANSLQQGFLYHSFKQSNVDDAYIVQIVSEYRTAIDENLFKMAWEYAQNRFSCLRLRFAWEDELVQIIDKVQPLDWRFIDLTMEDDVSIQESKIKEIQEKDRNERYKLERGNLFRVYLIKQKSELYGMILSFHHIILDGWSLPILVHYVHQDYLNLLETKRQSTHSSSLTCSGVRDETYENTQIYLQSHRLDNMDYWKSQMNTIEERCDFNSLLKQEYRNKMILNEYDHVKEPKLAILNICDDLYRNMKKTCRENGFTLSTILLFVWHKILNIYGNSSQTVIGTTISGRHIPVDNVENAVGLFINTLPSIMNHKIDISAIDAIKTLQNNMNEIIVRSNVDITQLNNGSFKRTLFDSLFIYENYPTLENKFSDKETSLKFETKYGVEKLDYALAVVAHEIIDKEHVEIVIHYAAELIENDTIHHLIDVAKHLLSQISKSDVRKVSELNLLPENESIIIQELNNTLRESVELNCKTTLDKLFEEEVEKSSEKIAVVYEDIQLSYRQLNEKANRLAHYLRSISNIHSDDIIALILDKSELMIITILGVWKSSAAYVPIDPNYPDERIKFILEDTKAKIMICNTIYSSRCDSYDIVKVEIDSLLVNEVLNESSMNYNLEIDTNVCNLAYVIYTSGTTGRPKGVMIEHKSIVSLRNDIKFRHFPHMETNPIPQNILFFSNYAFDVSIEQLALSILSSNTLIILPSNFTIDENFYAYLNKNQLTYLSGTPTQMTQIDFTQLKYLETITLSGEPLSEKTFKKMRKESSAKIVNCYGITETTVYNMAFCYQNQMAYKNSLGTYLSNTKRFVFNEKMQLLPTYAIGELYLTGNCLSRGYLNRPELTAQRFLPNPFQTKEEKKQRINERIYKSGDLVRWLPNGQLEYIGRNDFQVKIRGLRIELGEIEAILSSYQDVKQSVVIVRESKYLDAEGTNRKYTIGYFVSQSILLESDIKRYMQSKLPDYMIPNRLIQIVNIPVTTNGKIDLKSLPEIDSSKYDENSFSPPRNDLERKILRIWADLLCIPVANISTHDDFFGLGGDSILVMKLAIRLSNLLSTKVSISTVFANKTIVSLASHILHDLDYDSEKNMHILKMHADSSTDPNYSLSFAQERLWFIDQFHDQSGNNAYNIPIYLRFMNNNIRRDVLYQSLRAILSRHEILRTLIQEDRSGVFYQHLLNEEETDTLFKIDEVQVIHKEQLDWELNKLAQYVFNLRKELPIKVTFYEMRNTDEDEKTTFYMGIVIHHIAFDGWSLSIFWRELQIFYDHFQKKTPISGNNNTISDRTVNLPILPAQYKDFAAWQREYLSGQTLLDLSEFWKKKLDGFEMLNLMVDCAVRPSIYDYSGDEIVFELDEQVTNRLKALAMRLNVSLFSLLLSAYALMLSIYANQQDIIIGTPVANRNQPELENLIGFFVNVIVLRIQIDSKDLIQEYIKKVSNEVIIAQSHEDMPFEQLVKELQLEHDTSRHPIVQVVFLMNKSIDFTITSMNRDAQIPSPLTISEYFPNCDDFTVAKYDITTSLDDTTSSLKGTFNFVKKLFDRTTIEYFIETFIHILTQFSQIDETHKIIDIKCTDSLRQNQMKQFDNMHLVSRDVPKETTLYKLFEEEVEKSSEKIAVVYEDIQLSYRQLNEKANRLAHYLRSISNIHPDDIIALILDKSELMIISILGIWKSSAAYVPIDPNYPDERIIFILKDTKAKVVICNTKYSSKCDSYDIVKVEIDSLLAKDVLNDTNMTRNLEVDTNAKNLAYVIYTSGTTGAPKGVLVEHQSVISYRNDIKYRYFGDMNKFTTEHSILFFSNYVFDFSIEQLALSILSSNRLVIPPGNSMIDNKFYIYLNKNRLTYISATPSQMEQIDLTQLKYLKIITLGGETVSAGVFEKISRQFHGKIFNAYGITETTVCNMICCYENQMEYKNLIGTPLSNTKAFVLNKDMQVLPMLAIGELYLTGNCLSRGYLNQPELTAQRFLPNPFQTEEEKKEGKNERIYKTGDLVRWLPDGEFQYLGRNDYQVKIRGLRIELGEIETILSSYPGVKQCVVLVKEHKKQETETSSTKYLVGYYVSNCNIDESKMKSYMQIEIQADWL